MQNMEQLHAHDIRMWLNLRPQKIT